MRFARSLIIIVLVIPQCSVDYTRSSNNWFVFPRVFHVALFPVPRMYVDQIRSGSSFVILCSKTAVISFLPRPNRISCGRSDSGVFFFPCLSGANELTRASFLCWASRKKVKNRISYVSEPCQCEIQWDIIGRKIRLGLVFVGIYWEIQTFFFIMFWKYIICFLV